MRKSSVLIPPSTELLRRAGLCPDLLEPLGVIPQEAANPKFRYSLVCADLERVAVAEFASEGVEVVAGDKREIAVAWSKFRENTARARVRLSVGNAIRAAAQIARYAADAGAGEVFIGHPDDTRYEFGVADGSYSGVVHAGVYPALRSLLSSSSRITCDSNDPRISTVTISLTKNDQRPVLCLTWAPRGDHQLHQVRGEAAPSPRCALPSLPEGLASGQGKTIILADDDDRFTLIAASLLEGRGFSVWRAPNGAEAFRLLTQSCPAPDLVVSDIHMPGMNGSALLTRVRESGRNVPFLVLTSDEDVRLEAEMALRGADGFIRKSEDPSVLVAWCLRLVRAEALGSSAPALAAAEIGLTVETIAL